jgi:hypothetical protein
MPTMVIQSSVGVAKRRRLPMGSAPPKYVRTSVALTTTTAGAGS